MHHLATARRRIVTGLLMSLTVLSLVVTLFATASPSSMSALASMHPAQTPSHSVAAVAVEAAEPNRRDHQPAVVADPDVPVANPVVPIAPVAASAAPLILAPPVQLVALAPLTVDVWGAAERYFAISGDSPDEILASARANVPSDPSGADRSSMAYAGPIAWDHVPTYVFDAATGGCTMTGVSSQVAYQATLPQWTSPAEVQPALLAWWRVVLEHIRVHEGEHIRIFTGFVNELPGRVTGQPCSAWESIVNQWSAEIVSAQSAFDAAEAAWAPPRF